MCVDTRFPCGITVCVQSLLLFPSTDGSTPKLQVEVVEVLLPLRISLALEQLRGRQYWLEAAPGHGTLPVLVLMPYIKMDFFWSPKVTELSQHYQGHT